MIVETAMYFICALKPPGSRTHGWSRSVFILSLVSASEVWSLGCSGADMVGGSRARCLNSLSSRTSPGITREEFLEEGAAAGVPTRPICGVGTLWNAMDDTRGRGCRSWKLAQRMPRRRVLAASPGSCH